MLGTGLQIGAVESGVQLGLAQERGLASTATGMTQKRSNLEIFMVVVLECRPTGSPRVRGSVRDRAAADWEGAAAAWSAEYTVDIGELENAHSIDSLIGVDDHARSGVASRSPHHSNRSAESASRTAAVLRRRGTSPTGHCARHMRRVAER